MPIIRVVAKANHICLSTRVASYSPNKRSIYPNIEVMIEVINENKRPRRIAGSKFDFKNLWERNNKKVNKKAPMGKCNTTG